MWTYEQQTGLFGYEDQGSLMPYERGYSGFGNGMNNPLLQSMHDVGPIPKGVYTIGPAHHDPEKGPLVMALVPDVGNEMFGRAGFLIHGDSIEHPGEASHGCIILSHATRQAVADSSDRTLQVV